MMRRLVWFSDDDYDDDVDDYDDDENGLVLIALGICNICLNFMASEFFDRWRECRFYTARIVNKMAVCRVDKNA